MYEIYLCGVYLFSYFPASSFVGASGLFCALCDMFSLKMSSGWGANTTRNATDVNNSISSVSCCDPEGNRTHIKGTGILHFIH